MRNSYPQNKYADSEGYLIPFRSGVAMNARATFRVCFSIAGCIMELTVIGITSL